MSAPPVDESRILLLMENKVSRLVRNDDLSFHNRWVRIVLLIFTDRRAKHSWLFLAKSAAVFEFVTQENAWNGIRLDFVLVLLRPFCIRHWKEIHSAPERVQYSLINVFPVPFVIDAVAIDDLGSPSETEVSARICPPFVFKAGLQ